MQNKFIKLIPFFTLFVCLILTGTTYYFYRSEILEKEQTRFNNQTQEIKQNVAEHLEKYLALIRGGKGLFAASKRVEQEEWKKFVQTINVPKNYPGLLALGYISYVTTEKKSDFISQTQKTTSPDFQIWPETSNADFFPITYIEPFETNKKAIGYDLGSDPKIRHAIEATVEEGKPKITGKIFLVQSKENEPAFLLFSPVYNQFNPQTAEERTKHLEGWVYSAFLVRNFMQDILNSKSLGIDIDIFDGENTNPEDMLYDNDQELEAAGKNYIPHFSDISTLSIAGRTWTFVFKSLPSFNRFNIDRWRLNFILISGLAASFLLFAFVQLLTTTKQRARILAEKMSRECAKSAAFNAAILNGSNYGIISTDLNGVIQTFNNAAEKMLGYKAQEVIGKMKPDSFHDPREIEDYAITLSKELGEKISANSEDVFTTKIKRGLIEEKEWTYIRKDKTRFPALVSITAIRDTQTQEVQGFMGVVIDITERKKIEKMKNEFISVVSHELRTPLTSIKGSLGLITGGVTKEPLPEKTQSLIRIALNNCDRLIKLINDILDIEKMESGKMRFETKIVNMVELIQQSIEINTGYANQFKIKLQLDSIPKEALRVEGDPDRLSQVLTNLFSNAVKFSPPGETVHINLYKKNNKVRVEIKDNGSGIPPEFRSQIFKKFAQLDSSNTRTKGGTGLGLSISKTILEKSGGEINFESELGKGSTFYFELPSLPANS